jgi:hypothetical protein
MMDLSYEILRSPKWKKLTITVERDRAVVVHVPEGTSDDDIKRGRSEVKAQWRAVLSRVAPAHKMAIKLLERNVSAAEILKACEVAAGGRKVAPTANDQTLYDVGVQSAATLLGLPVLASGRSPLSDSETPFTVDPGLFEAGAKAAKMLLSKAPGMAAR